MDYINNTTLNSLYKQKIIFLITNSHIMQLHISNITYAKTNHHSTHKSTNQLASRYTQSQLINHLHAHHKLSFINHQQLIIPNQSHNNHPQNHIRSYHFTQTQIITNYSQVATHKIIQSYIPNHYRSQITRSTPQMIIVNHQQQPQPNLHTNPSKSHQKLSFTFTRSTFPTIITQLSANHPQNHIRNYHSPITRSTSQHKSSLNYSQITTQLFTNHSQHTTSQYKSSLNYSLYHKSSSPPPHNHSIIHKITDHNLMKSQSFTTRLAEYLIDQNNHFPIKILN